MSKSKTIAHATLILACLGPTRPAKAETPAECLATIAYQEARGEGFMGMLAVAHAAQNRARRDRKPICRAIRNHRIFTVRGQLKGRRKDRPWEQAQAAGILARSLPATDPTKGATFYHATYVHPHWADVFTRTAQIGNHVFYRGNDHIDQSPPTDPTPSFLAGLKGE
jgi:N-acetylmuramoyl-L-alanine amidase